MLWQYLQEVETCKAIHLIWCTVLNLLPFTVAARSKAWTVFSFSNAGIVGSNPIWGLDVCVRYSVFELYCVQVAASRHSSNFQ
jgi:hypothetical protein